MNIAEVDWASTSTKTSTDEGYCVCWNYTSVYMYVNIVEQALENKKYIY